MKFNKEDKITVINGCFKGQNGKFVRYEPLFDDDQYECIITLNNDTRKNEIRIFEEDIEFDYYPSKEEVSVVGIDDYDGLNNYKLNLGSVYVDYNIPKKSYKNGEDVYCFNFEIDELDKNNEPNGGSLEANIKYSDALKMRDYINEVERFFNK